MLTLFLAAALAAPPAPSAEASLTAASEAAPAADLTATGGSASVCRPTTPLRQDTLSVAWVSPLTQRAGGRTWLTVVSTAELRAWVTEEHADLTRLLQGLGRRRSDEPPRRGWKVVVFDVAVDALCRPTDGTPGTDLGGAPVCATRARGVDGRDRGCGHSVDRLDNSKGLDLFQIRWDDAARQGFCVLPVDRFLDGR